MGILPLHNIGYYGMMSPVAKWSSTAWSDDVLPQFYKKYFY